MHNGLRALLLGGVLAGCSAHEGSRRAPQRSDNSPSSAASNAAQAPRAWPAATAATTGKPLDARLDGFGVLTLGMDMTAAGQAWPGVFDRLPRMAEGVCFHTSPPGLADVSLMFDDGRFVRYDASSNDLVAPGGGRSGIGEAQLQALYRGSLRAAPHRLASGGKSLVLDASGVAPSRLVFETDRRGMVIQWRVGLRPHVDYSEGCQGDSR